MKPMDMSSADVLQWLNTFITDENVIKTFEGSLCFMQTFLGFCDGSSAFPRLSQIFSSFLHKISRFRILFMILGLFE